MTDASQLTSRFDSLRNRALELNRDLLMEGISGELNTAAEAAATLPEAIKAVRQKGYTFAAYLEQKSDHLRQLWERAQIEARSALRSETMRLQMEVRQVEVFLQNAFSAATNPPELASILPNLEREIIDAETKLKAAHERVTALYVKVKQEIDQTREQVADIDWYLEQRNEASFPFQPEEKLFLAAKAEWSATGKGRQDPDGILYLTDKRLIFEQKEKTGKTLGMFGGKQTQELKWEVPLSQLEKVEAENKGLFGGKDMLHFSLRPGAITNQLTVEVKGKARCKFWAGQIERMVKGETEDERAIAVDAETLAAIREAPIPCHICGGTLPQLVLGQKSVKCDFCGAEITL